jgi:serine-type D-Ala-D-Ala carboxypeptidase/endopeptidase
MYLKFPILLLYSLLLCVTDSHEQTICHLDGSSISPDSLNQRITLLMQKARVTGLGVSILNHNEAIYSKTFGRANEPAEIKLEPTQVMYGASLSKAVFAYLVMLLVQEKIISLDKPLVSYLAEPLPNYQFAENWQGYQDLKDDSRYEKITARMCLDHTTGFPNWRWINQSRKLDIKFEPGSRYRYSGEGIYLLQFVIEKITGKDLETLARERVFIPLQMTHTSYVCQENFASQLVLGHNSKGKPYHFKQRSEANAAGSLCTTLEDYTRFFTALMQHTGLSTGSFSEMISPQIRIRQIKQFGPLSWQDSTLNDVIQLSYGLGYGVMKTPAGPAFFKEGHDDGWQHFSIGYPDKGIALVIMCNSDQGESIFKELLELTIGDTYAPWYWENYIPYDYPVNQNKIK